MAIQVIGWVGIAYSWFSLISVVMTLFFLGPAIELSKAFMPELGEATENATAIFPYTVLVGAVFNIALLVLCIGILQLKPWARSYLVVWALLSALRSVILQLLSWWLFDTETLPEPWKVLSTVGSAFAIIVNISLLIGLAVFLQSAKVRNQFERTA